MPPLSLRRPLGALLALVLACAGLLATAPAHAAPAVQVVTAGPVLPGETLMISGTGFTPGQRLAIKMDRDSYGQIGADEGESAGPSATRERIQVDETGAFHDEPVTIPRFTPNGSATLGGAHTLHLLDNDPVTSVTVPFTTRPDFTAALTASTDVHGGSVTVTGTGWVDRAGTGGSRIAAIIETVEGTDSFDRTPGHLVHDKPQVWALGTATAAGDFTLSFDLPDGSGTGAGGSTPALGGGDLGIRLRSGSWLDGATDDITRSVELTGISLEQRLTSTLAPTVTGAAQVGATLRAGSGSWTPADGLALGWQWLRAGLPIPGASTATYTVGPADLGKRLTVAVTATHPSAGTARAVSAPTAAVAPGRLVSTGRPRISGTAKAGKKLKASAGQWAPTGARVTYRWLRNGKAVAGATRATYAVRKADRGAKLVVVVTAAKPGYASASARSAAIRVAR